MNIPEIDSTSLVVVDLQTKLTAVMDNYSAVQERATLMLKGANALELDVIVTEQYPAGLGPTVPEIAELLPPGCAPIAKTGFSVFAEPAFRIALKAKSKNCLIFLGIETHVCLLQSVYDARKAGYEVIVCADAVTSRSAANRELALAEMRTAGAHVLPVESILFLLLRDAKHPAFKTVSKLIR
ncbi:isochorismatase family protein [uncultured Victivallis sp.]|uniref:isochorismatase family protein n=1 Tax=uncultured Victivallis sp. TaxID=354118 RepID=UPI0025EEF421|nr:isochorismatase family protein [uncultured Victivallis sp.]